MAKIKRWTYINDSGNEVEVIEREKETQDDGGQTYKGYRIFNNGSGWTIEKDGTFVANAATDKEAEEIVDNLLTKDSSEDDEEELTTDSDEDEEEEEKVLDTKRKRKTKDSVGNRFITDKYQINVSKQWEGRGKK